MNKTSAPLTVWLEVTKKCNLKCKHCIVKSEDRSMPKDSAMKIVDMLSEARVLKLYITGGEPLLWESLPEIVSYANSKGIWTLVQTNGALLTDPVAEKLAESKVGALDISIYGVNEATHNYITDSVSSFSEILKALRTCEKYGIRVFVSFVILKNNLNELPKVFEWGIERRLNLLHIRRYVAKSLDDPLRPTNPEFKESIKESMDALKRINANHEKIHVEFEEAFPFHRDLGRNICAASFQMCFIDVEGRISPCPFLRIFGDNVLERGFKNAWADSTILNQLRDIKDFEGHCGTCEFRNECKGGCRAAAYYAYSFFKASDPDCWVGA